MDAIGHPELTWRNQKLLEKRGLRPVPVVHYRTDPKWLDKYVLGRYELIALGGLVGSHGQEACRDWIDKCFTNTTHPKTRMPRQKLHGFGVTSFSLLLRYPWWSVDSSTWTQVGAWGGVFCPPREYGKYVFTKPPYIIKVSDDSPERKLKGRHFGTMTPDQKGVVLGWLEQIGVPLGRLDGAGEVAEYGVTNRHSERKVANLFYFEELRKHIPAWPWPWARGVKRKGLF